MSFFLNKFSNWLKGICALICECWPLLHINCTKSKDLFFYIKLVTKQSLKGWLCSMGCLIFILSHDYKDIWCNFVSGLLVYLLDCILEVVIVRHLNEQRDARQFLYQSFNQQIVSACKPLEVKDVEATRKILWVKHDINWVMEQA